MKHKDKVRLARKMRSRNDIKNHEPIFGTKAWDIRKLGIAGRVQRQQGATHKRALQRKELSKQHD